MKRDDLVTPNWNVEIFHRKEVLRTTVYDADALLPKGIERGDGVAVSGIVDRAGYVYVLLVADDGEVAVLHPADGRHRKEIYGVDLRLPMGSGYFDAPIKGRVRVVEAPNQVAPSEWAKILDDGRDPPKRPSTVKNSRTQQKRDTEASADSDSSDENEAAESDEQQRTNNPPAPPSEG